MEAMALGLPCISTDCPCGGPRFLIRNWDNGVLVPVGGENELSDAIVVLVSNPSYSERISREAVKIQHRLAPEAIYDMWEKFIIHVCVEKD